MTEQPVAPVTSLCWPKDQDYLDGRTEIELPPRRYTQVFWDADILDLDDKDKSDTIIGTEQAFAVRFRVEVRGRLWNCMTGDWIFDVGFKPIGTGPGFYLSSLLPANSGLIVKGWRGCDTHCIEQYVTVPAGTIQLDDNIDTEVFEVAAKAELRCCDSHIAVAAYEALEEYQFFRGA